MFFVLPITPDDPYITFRYATNLAHGNGPVYNLGERVEGFTSPLHLVLSALFIRLFPHADVLLAAKAAGIVFALVMIHRLGGLARQVHLSSSEAVVAQLLLALNINLAVSAANGLETTLYGALLLWTGSTFLREVSGKGGHGSALLLALCVLARPEAMIVYVGLSCAGIWLVLRRRLAVRDLGIWTAWFAVPFAALVAMRLAYFGLPLPNTFYAKAVPLRYAAALGVHYLGRPLSPKTFDLMSGESVAARAVLVAAPLVFWGLAAAGLRGLRRRTGVLVCAAVVASTVGFVLKAGGDWMQGWRFMVAALPFVCVLQCLGARSLVRWLRGLAPRHPAPWVETPSVSRARAVRWVEATALAFWGVSAWIAPKVSWASVGYSMNGETLLGATGSGAHLGANQVAMAHLVQDVLSPSATFAYTEMGYIGYLNMDKRIVDMRGLTDPEVAGVPGALKSATGVNDANWFDPSSSVGRILSRRALDAVAAFEDKPMVLGRYLKAYSTGGIQLYMPGSPAVALGPKPGR